MQLKKFFSLTSVTKKKVKVCFFILILIGVGFKIIVPKEKAKSEQIGGPKVKFKSVTSAEQPLTLPKKNTLTFHESSDANVKKAWQDLSWQVIPTEQTGHHQTNYQANSSDRLELTKGILEATNLPSDDLIEWWIGEIDEQTVFALVSNQEQSLYYRLTFSWQKNQGWLCQLNEELWQLPSY